MTFTNLKIRKQISDLKIPKSPKQHVPPWVRKKDERTIDVSSMMIANTDPS